MTNTRRWVIGSRMALLLTIAGTASLSSQAQCLEPNTSINFSNTGNNTATGYTTVYVLTNAAGVIQNTVTNGFNAPSTGGNYKIYAVNYSTANGNTAPTLTSGTNISAIGGTCVNVSASPATFCITGGCVAPGSNVSFANSGQNTTSGYITKYVVTDNSGTILSVPTATTFSAPGTNGTYKVYTVNYNSASGNTPPALTVGSNISAIGGTCVATSQPAQFCVQATTLPVTLTDFSAEKEDRTTKLRWETTDQINAEKFDIERSTDTKSWSAIGTKAAEAESQATIQYEFTDASPLAGTNFYRLKMYGRDAASTYSVIRSVKFDAGNNTWVIHPNPASNIFYLKDATGGSVDMQSVKELDIINAAGATVLKSREITNAGINIQQLINGLYIVRITMKDGTNSTHKLVVVK